VTAVEALPGMSGGRSPVADRLGTHAWNDRARREAAARTRGGNQGRRSWRCCISGGEGWVPVPPRTRHGHPGFRPSGGSTPRHAGPPSDSHGPRGRPCSRSESPCALRPRPTGTCPWRERCSGNLRSSVRGGCHTPRATPSARARLGTRCPYNACRSSRSPTTSSPPADPGRHRSECTTSVLQNRSDCVSAPALRLTVAGSSRDGGG
jgi:hypothetical protein